MFVGSLNEELISVRRLYTMEKGRDTVEPNAWRIGYPWLACCFVLVLYCANDLHAYSITDTDRNVAHGIMVSSEYFLLLPCCQC